MAPRIHVTCRRTALGVASRPKPCRPDRCAAPRRFATRVFFPTRRAGRHAPSLRARGCWLQTALLLVGTAFGLVACFLLAPLGPVAAGWVAAPEFDGVFEGAGAAAVGAVASFVGFLALLWFGVSGALAARLDVVFITGSFGVVYVAFSLPLVAAVGAALGRVGYVARGFAFHVA